MSSASLPSPMISAVALLGGEGVLHARPRMLLDWIQVVRRGLPSASVDAVVRLTRITQVELAQALAIPERTQARCKREGKLSPEESAKFVRLARVLERVEVVFDGAPCCAVSPRHGPAASP